MLLMRFGVSVDIGELVTSSAGGLTGLFSGRYAIFDGDGLGAVTLAGDAAACGVNVVLRSRKDLERGRAEAGA